MTPYELGQELAFAKLGMKIPRTMMQNFTKAMPKPLRKARVAVKKMVRKNPKTALGVGAGTLGYTAGNIDGGEKRAAPQEKNAFIGWTNDIAAGGLPSLLGYAIADTPHSNAEALERRDHGYSLMGGAFVPGYTGYHFGRKHKAQDYLSRTQGRQEAREEEAGPQEKEAEDVLQGNEGYGAGMGYRMLGGMAGGLLPGPLKGIGMAAGGIGGRSYGMTGAANDKIDQLEADALRRGEKPNYARAEFGDGAAHGFVGELAGSLGGAAVGGLAGGTLSMLGGRGPAGAGLGAILGAFPGALYGGVKGQQMGINSAVADRQDDLDRKK